MRKHLLFLSSFTLFQWLLFFINFATPTKNFWMDFGLGVWCAVFGVFDLILLLKELRKTSSLNNLEQKKETEICH